MSSATDNRYDEHAISQGAAIVFVFLIGVVILSLIYLIRIDILLKRNSIGMVKNIVEKTSPVLRETVQSTREMERNRQGL